MLVSEFENINKMKLYYPQLLTPETDNEIIT